MLKNLYTIIFGVGAAASTLTAVVKPELLSIPLAAMGGTLAGASLMNEQRRIAELKFREASKVTTAFQQAYSKNRGIVQAEEISIFGEIPIEKAVAFLDALATEEGGQAIEAGPGKTYAFPHPENALQTLNENAKNWANAQLQQLQAENNSLRQMVATLQRPATNPVAAGIAQARGLQKQQKQEAEQNPWNELL